MDPIFILSITTPDMLIRYSLAALLALPLSLSHAFAQQVVRGQLTDGDTGEPLIGATVKVVGADVGTLTDYDGNYELEVTPPTDLQFSYVGYATQVESITAGRTTVNLALRPGQVLDEVVVIGYGSVKKDDLTGSVAAVTEDEFNNGAIVSPTNLIAGKIAGVQVGTASGEPGAGPTIRIRGGTSINASNEPLYVVDGVPLDNAGFAGGRSPLNFISPDDIATITVLKDASATAIYGSRGANGVVIITTKTGKEGAPPSVTYDGSVTVSNIAGDAPTLDAEAFRNVVTFAAPERLGALGSARTDWFDEVTRTGLGQQHAVAVAGGGKGLTYRIGGGYTDIEGTLVGSQTERVTTSINLRQTLLDERLSIAVNLKGARTRDLFDSGVGGAWFFDPTQPIRDASLPEFAGYFEYGVGLAPRNPVSTIEQVTNRGSSLRGLGNVEVGYDFDALVPGLGFRVNAGFDQLSNRQEQYRPTTYSTLATDGFDGEARIENGLRRSSLLETYLTYDRSFGAHTLGLTAGYSYQDFSGEFPRYRAFNFDNDLFGLNSTAAANEFEAATSAFENRLISFFGRANYNLNERLLLTATLRRDGSTRFGPGNRWGLFPSAAVAWRVLEEPFAAGLASVFSDLKVRVGWGITGNQDFGNFLYLPRYQLSDTRTRYQFGDRFITTARPNGYDEDLKWEETTTTNVGLDFGFAEGRVNGSLDYYLKDTEDLLFTVNVPAGTNLTNRVLTNVGAIRNQGVELSLGAFVVDNAAFRWELNGNVSYNGNEVRALAGDAAADIQVGGISGGIGNTVQLLRVGEAVNSFYLYEHLRGPDGSPLRDGVDHNGDEVVNQLDLYRDVNGDGEINNDDLVISGQAAPRTLFGLTSSMSYGDLSLAFTLRGGAGNKVYNNNASNAGYLNYLTTNPVALNNVHESALVTRFQSPQFLSDYYLEDGGFVRLDNVTLGYDVPRIKDALDVRVYVTGQNLFVLTDYGGLDPELLGDNPGIDNTPYPRARTFVVGARIGF